MFVDYNWYIKLGYVFFVKQLTSCRVDIPHTMNRIQNRLYQHESYIFISHTYRFRCQVHLHAKHEQAPSTHKM